jgi:Na+:H+ antiporter, NhaA family
VENYCVRVLRSVKFPAIALIIAGTVGLLLANSPIASIVFDVRDTKIGYLSVGHWVTDGLLAIFFFLAAIELKHELRHGELDSPSKALVPSLAAVGGVIVPALIFLVLTGDGAESAGWPIPAATDIAFALGILAIAGRALPPRVRALLLALAIIDDLIAIAIIALVFPGDLRPLPLVIAVPLVLLFGWLSDQQWTRRVLIPILIVIGMGVWALVSLSGIHPTIAGVALGLALASRRGEAVRYAIEPYSNAIVLPIFAVFATLVVLPDLAVSSPGIVFWAIVIALPLGKVIGITGGALIAGALDRSDRPRVPVADLLVIGTLGGIGFTVSLLMSELAFGTETEYGTDGTLGVLCASIIAAVAGAILAALRSRVYVRREAQGARSKTEKVG